jgi:mRNA interferase RelE/StbE
LKRYRIEFLPSALKEFESLPKAEKRKAARHISGLVDHPRPPGVKALAGGDQLYRLRSGDYRIVYQIQDKALVVSIVRLGHRSDVYR